MAMSLDQIQKVDAIGEESKTNHAVLTILDSWDWIDVGAHLTALQAKLNAYFEFIESGQIWDAYPLAEKRQLRINVIFRYFPPACVASFLTQASIVASQLSVLISHETIPDAGVKG